MCFHLSFILSYIPLKDVIPYRYHGYLGEDLLKSYVVRNHEDGRKCEEEGFIPPGCNLIVTSQQNYEEIYPQICKNLTEIGKDAIKDIKPWIINCLIDLGNFDQVICTCPIRDDAVVSEPWIINCLIDFGNFEQVICTCPIRDDAVASESSVPSREDTEASGQEDLDTSCQGGSINSGTASSYVWMEKDTKYFLSLKPIMSDKPKSKENGNLRGHCFRNNRASLSSDTVTMRDKMEEPQKILPRWRKT